jgi:hypothetical protein
MRCSGGGGLSKMRWRRTLLTRRGGRGSPETAVDGEEGGGGDSFFRRWGRLRWSEVVVEAPIALEGWGEGEGQAKLDGEASEVALTGKLGSKPPKIQSKLQGLQNLIRSKSLVPNIKKFE